MKNNSKPETGRLPFVLVFLAFLMIWAACGIAIAEELQVVDPIYGTPYIEVEVDGSGFVYNDCMLMGSSSEFSTDLVKASVALAEAGYDGRAARMLHAMDYKNVALLNNSKRTIDDCDKVAYTVGYKDVPDTNVRIWAIVVRGTSENCEWFSDFNLGKDNGGVHRGFDLAANETEELLLARISGSNGGRNIFWFTGHSRGAAVANILAGRFTKRYGAANVFAYTFACPSVRKDADTSMTNIFNINNAGDLIPTLPLEKWGYKRYGRTRTYPFNGYSGFMQRKSSYQGLGNTQLYEEVLNRLVPDEKSYHDPIRFFAVNILAYALGGRTEVEWPEFALYYGADVADELIYSTLTDSIGPLALFQSLVEQIGTIPELLALITETIELTQNMSEEEFAEYLLNNAPRIYKIEKATGKTISSIPGLEEAKTIVLAAQAGKIAWTAGEIIGCALELCNETGDIIASIWDAHEPDSYVKWINSVFYGYMGLTSVTGGAADTMRAETNGYAITTIGQHCFAGCTDLATADFSNTRFIAAHAFASCYSLQNVTFTDNLTFIGNQAFGGCGQITEITVPDSVQKLGEGCLPTSLQKLTTPFIGSSRQANRTPDAVIWYLFGFARNDTSGLYSDLRRYTSSSSETYYKCSTLKEISVTDSSVIPDFAFCGLESLVSVSFADGTETIGASAMNCCTSLVNVEFPDSVTEMGDGEIYGDGLFYNCTSLEAVTLPPNLTAIPAYAFTRCAALSAIVLPDTIVSVGDFAFSGCTLLAELTIPDTVQTLGEGCVPSTIQKLTTPFIGSSRQANRTPDAVIWYLFGFARNDTSGTYSSWRRYSSSSSDIYSKCTTLKEITVTDSTVIPDFAFCGLESLVSVSFADGTETIGASAMNCCTSLVNVEFPDSVTAFGDDTVFGDGLFYNCTSLETVALSPNLAALPAYAFSNCTALAAIDLPGSLVSIGDFAFFGCSHLMELTIPDSVQTLGQGCLPSCIRKLATPFVGSNRQANRTPDAVIWYLFGYGGGNSGEWRRYSSSSSEIYRRNTTLEEIRVTDSAVIPDFAFCGLESLKSVSFADRTKTIGASAMNSCSGLVHVEFPDSVTELAKDTAFGDGLFYNCGNLRTIKLPSGLVCIPDWVFSRCTGLLSVILPDCLTEIRPNAFSGCSGLSDVYFFGSAEQWDAIQIGSGNESLLAAALRHSPLRTIDLPASLTDIESEAFSCLPDIDAVRIPESVVSISEDAFDPHMILIIRTGSCWAQWADTNGFLVLEEP